jgi:LuxR family maltose regulon positive regulatory protein
MAQTSRPLLLREIEAGQARLALLAGDLVAVQCWHATRAQPGAVPRIQQEQEALLVARLHIAQGEANTALGLLATWRAESYRQGRVKSELEIQVVTALAHAVLADLPQARQILIQAVALAQPEGYQRLFLDEGEQIADLLRAVFRTIKEEPLVTYVRTMLLAFAEEQSAVDAMQRPEALQAALLIEPLSAQELRVLRLLAAGLSNSEIARDLVISLNTVKTHVKNVFGKLDVRSRDEACDVARQLDLL